MDETARLSYYWGPLIQCKPIITSSSKYFVAAMESIIKVFSVANGSLVATLKEHQKEIVGLAVINNEDQFISCDESGKLCMWQIRSDSTKNTLKKVLHLAGPDFQEEGRTLTTFVTRKKYDVILVGFAEGKESTGVLLSFTQPFEASLPALIGEEIKVEPSKVAISEQLDFMVYLEAKNLVVKNVKDNSVQRHMLGQNEITCLTCHPSKLVLATGDCLGRIHLWYNIFSKPSKHELHWHHLPVVDLAFSVTGAELYSGGGECVLVKWQMIENKRYFIPRLGMPIKYVLTDRNNSKIICAHLDSAFTVMSAEDFNVLGYFQGLSMSIDRVNPFPAGIKYDPRTKSIVLNGKSGHVQFYDLNHNKLLYQLDIVRENYINPERVKKIYNVEVEKLAVSPDGNWLATIEYRDDFENSLEVRLKFWQFDSKSQSWTLNTGVDMPHDKYVNELTFTPSLESNSPLVCLSCSDDGKFKIWEVIDNSDIYRESSVWHCRNIGFFRHLPATTVTVAPDGSLIAAGFANILTLWTLEGCHLKGTLSQPYLKEHVRQIEFGRTETCGSMLVSRSDIWLCGWNLFTCTLSWRIIVNSICMAVDPLTSHMAVFSKSCDCFIFEPRNKLVYTRLQKVTRKPVVCAAFVPREDKPVSSTHWNSESDLFTIDSAQRLNLIEPVGDTSSSKTSADGVVQKLIQDTDGLPMPTPFASIVAQTRASDAIAEKNDQWGSASFGINVQNSSAILQKVMDEARVYRLDCFDSLTNEFFKLILPESVTSKELQEKEDVEVLLEKHTKEIAIQNRKIEKRKKKKNVERGLNSNFSDLIDMLSDQAV